MSTRYDDREYDRDEPTYGRRSEQGYRRSYGNRSQSRYGYGGTERESERYGREGHSGSEYGGRYSSSSRQEYPTGRESYGRGGWESERDYSEERDRMYGGYGGGYGRGYSESTGGYSQRYNYPTGYRSGEAYEERERDYERGGYGRGERRGWWDRTADEVASWFGDEEAERRRRMDEQREYRGRGPKGYRRSDERIKEDINDRLSDDYYLDASDVEVSVTNTEVTLIGTVNSRSDKRRAEDIAEGVSGVTNVENRLRVKQAGMLGTYAGGEATSTTSPTTSSSAAAGAGTGRAKATGT